MKMLGMITFTYEIMDDLDGRLKAYGEVDPMECAKIDIQRDPHDTLKAADEGSITVKIVPLSGV